MYCSNQKLLNLIFFSILLLLPFRAFATTIDILVLYSPGAQNKYQTGLNTRINHHINVANTIFRSSGVDITLNPVLITRFDISDQINSVSALRSVTNTRYPAYLREKFNADLVVLFRPYVHDGRCGVAWVNGYKTNGRINRSSDKRFAYSHVSINCAPYVLVHEIGHNLGLRHSRRTSPSGGTFSFSTGHGMNHEFATIMAYERTYSARKLLRFSSPRLNCGRFACGVDSSNPRQGADAVRSLNLVRDQVANYYATGK